MSKGLNGSNLRVGHREPVANPENAEDRALTRAFRLTAQKREGKTSSDPLEVALGRAHRFPSNKAQVRRKRRWGNLTRRQRLEVVAARHEDAEA
jgi:hypothetical protein